MDEQERTKQNRRRARNWALVIGAVAVVFYLGIFFLIHTRY
ncbi:hypothetical protein [Natronospira bacteriovora]|uniref:Uncharacterized protein n=1 Tax=Natronospira bacteriovora TaxID=3069753 RepID=A0ABU0WB53_9GAMM|nr:hypothetical protein [Natronospira sp. AB-CW4]MDQ2070170.1 hypothetical protein [Natronospira sp. AB-CW4]